MSLMSELKTGFRSDLEAVAGYQGISGRSAARILFFILALFAAFRIATIGAPAIDRTAWKEIDYIMISQNYYEHGYNFLRPETSWPADEPRVAPMEFPLAPFLASLLYPVLGVNAFSVRFVTLAAFLLIVVYVYKLVKREAGALLALLSAFFAGLLPLFSPFRNYLFSEPLLFFFSLFSIYHFAQWADFGKRRNLLSFIIGFALAVAMKPTELYILLPLGFILFRKFRFHVSAYLPYIWPFAVAMILPVLWYYHAYQLSKNALPIFAVFGGVGGGHDLFQTADMLRDPSWYLTMAARLRRLLLGLPGFLMIFFGLVIAFRRKPWQLFIVYLFSVFCFFAIVAEGQIDAPYRQLAIIPPASFLLALGAAAFSVLLYRLFRLLFRQRSRKPALVFSLVLCTAFLSLLPVRRPHFILPPDKEAPVNPYNWMLAQEIRKNATENSRIILAGEYTIHKGGNDISPVTYYYSGLQGWTIQEGEWSQTVIDSLKQKGAGLFGALNYSREPGLEAFVRSMAARYEVLYDNPGSELLLLSLEPDVE